MLNSRALALTNRDVAAYLAPLSPEAQLVETPFAQGALSVPVSGLHMKLEEEAHAGSRNRFESAKVEISFGYEGLAADNIFRLNVVYDLARTGTSWTASSSRIETSPDPPVWMTGPVEVKRSEHFLAFFRPGLASSQTALDRAEEARRRLQAKLPLTLDRAHLILLAHNRAEYEQLSAEDVPLSAVAQAETNFAISETSIAAEGRLIVVNLERLLTQSDAIEIFQHELAHLGLAAETRPFTPAWVGESAAMYLAGSRPILTWREGSRRGSFDHLSFSELTRAPALGQHDPTGASPSLEYAYAAAAA